MMMPSDAKVARAIAKYEADKKKREVVGVLPSDGSVALMVNDLNVITDHAPVIGFLVERWPSGHIEVHPLGTDGALDDDDYVTPVMLHSNGVVRWPSGNSWPSLAAFEEFLAECREEEMEMWTKIMMKARGMTVVSEDE